MNRASLVLSVTEQTDLGITAASEAVDAVLRALVHTLASGTRVTLPGLGVLDPYIRPGRQGRHPRTGEPVVIEDKITVKFRASDRLIAYANEPGLLPAAPGRVALTGARPRVIAQ